MFHLWSRVTPAKGRVFMGAFPFLRVLTRRLIAALHVAHCLSGLHCTATTCIAPQRTAITCNLQRRARLSRRGAPMNSNTPATRKNGAQERDCTRAGRVPSRSSTGEFVVI